MAKSKRRPFRLTPKRKRALAWIGVLAAFVVALTAWSAGPTDKHVDLPNLAQPTDVFAPSTSDGPSTLPSSRPTGKPGKGLANILQVLPNLPGESRDVNPASLPARSVTMTITSDRPILRVGYRVLYGHPDTGKATDVASPMQITETGRGYGLVAAIGAQATPIATWISCTVTVDGHLHSRHTVRGGYSVVVCLG